MAICRKCKKAIIGWGYTVHHGNYHPKCLKEKYPDAEGLGGSHVILNSDIRNLRDNRER